MSLLVDPQEPALPLTQRRTSDAEVRRCVGSMLAELAPQYRRPERRRHRRYAFPYPVALTPIDGGEGGQLLQKERFVVVGKHLSERGLDFYHSQPIAFRRVLAEFDLPSQAEGLTLILELTWCRFGKLGWYENGGRFVCD